MGAPSNAVRDLAAYLSDEASRGRFSGAIRLSVRRTPILDAAYGIADRTTGELIVRDTAFQMASVSKQFAAAAILLLQERGRLSPMDSIRRWIRGCPDSWEPITIHHLLTHTSGLPHWRDIPELDLFTPATPDHILSVFSSHPLKFAPGKGWAYSSPGYHLVARIIEEVSGKGYADFLRREIFEPLRMAWTDVGNLPRTPNRALGYDAGLPTLSFELETASRGAGDVWSTTGDLSRWDEAVSTPGRLLSKSVLETASARHVAVSSSEADRFPWIRNLSYGYGWYLGELEGAQILFHPGDNPGYVALNVILPEADATLCALSNDESTDLSRVALRLLGGFLSAAH